MEALHVSYDKGYNMKSIEVTFQGYGDIKLAGTLTLPDGDGPFPAVICIHGSGNVDRNESPDRKTMLEDYENQKAEGKPVPSEFTEPSQWNIFRDVAWVLAGAGIACLRYDKRGTGLSEGDRWVRPLSTLKYDVEAGIAYLRKHALIDGRRVGVFGHSEGGLIGPMVCRDDLSIKTMCFMGSAATNLKDILFHQVNFISSLSEAKRIELGLDPQRNFIAEFEKFIKDIDAGEEWGLLPVGGRIHLAWWREHFRNDPAHTIQAVKCPILILQGAKDYQVPVSEAALLMQALQGVSHPDYEIDVFPDLNHIMFPVDGVSDGTEYNDPRGHISAEVLGNIVRWHLSKL
jgi:uncharacterized protein